MKISIVTPSYNQVKFLEESLLSVWTQEGDFDLEHIVADGGSTDGSVELLKKYDHLYRAGKFKHSCRSFTFKWWSRQDSGQSEAINKGFEISTGEVLNWLNSDDTYINSKSLSVLQQPLLEDKADIVVSNGYHIDEENTILDIPILINKLNNIDLQQRLGTLNRYNFILQPAVLFRRDVWENCPIVEQYHFIMDWVLWVEAWQKGFRFCKIKDFTATNRLHRSAKTVEGGIEKYEEGLTLFRRYNTWCLNRSYYLFYLILLRAQKIPFWGGFVPIIIKKLKRIRVSSINFFRLY